MNRLLNAEEVLDLMLNHCSLSRYDQKFFYNLQLNNILSRNPITSNQAKLFTKVVKKYVKQLSLHKVDANIAAELPWTLKIIESSPDYTHAHISIEDDELILRCPYKQAFVQEFRDKSVMVWNREKKQYNTDFGLYKLKVVISSVMKHYDQIKFCDKIQNIVNEISTLDENACWEPTLTICNDRLYIFNLNESLDKALHNVELNTELSTLALLCAYGINVSEKLKKELFKKHAPEDVTFAINRQNVWEVTDVVGLSDKLKKINCDYTLHLSIHQTTESENYHKILANLVDFPVQSSNMRKLTIAVKDYKMPVICKSMSAYTFSGAGCYYAGKIINLVNSNPIDIK